MLSPVGVKKGSLVAVEKVKCPLQHGPKTLFSRSPKIPLWQILRNSFAAFHKGLSNKPPRAGRLLFRLLGMCCPPQKKTVQVGRRCQGLRQACLCVGDALFHAPGRFDLLIGFVNLPKLGLGAFLDFLAHVGHFVGVVFHR